MKSLDIIVPVHNKEEYLDELFDRLNGVKNSLLGIVDVRFLFVNDGSKDKSKEILKNYAQGNSHVKVINFVRNFGYQISITAGINTTDADYIAILNADMQDPPELIIDMYNKAQEGYDIIYGKLLSRENETFFKKATAFGFYKVLSFMCKFDIPKDTRDFKLITRNVINVLKNMPEHNRFIKGIVPWTGFNSTYIGYNIEEGSEKTHSTLKSMIKLASNIIFSFSTKPLLMINYIAVFLILCAIYSFIRLNIISATILFCSSLQLFAIGIIGTYIARIYDESLKRPLYIIKDKYNIGE